MVDRYRNYQPYRPTMQPRKSHRRGIFVITVVGALIIGGIFIGRRIDDSETTKAIAAIAKTKPKKAVTAEPISSEKWNEISQQLNTTIAAHPDLDLSVTVIDINSSTKANYGVQESFAGASTTKVLTAVTFLHQVELGQASFSQSLNGVSAQQQLKQMINQSNNESWSALNQAVGGTVLENYAHSIGMSSYKYTGNLMTASDEALLLQKLYSGKLLSNDHRRLLFSYMQNTNNEDMIPAVAPSGSTLYHKYGQLDTRLHDAAIVTYKNRPIVLVIYTKGPTNANGTEYTSRVQLIRNLAETVFSNIYQ